MRHMQLNGKIGDVNTEIHLHKYIAVGKLREKMQWRNGGEGSCNDTHKY